MKQDLRKKLDYEYAQLQKWLNEYPVDSSTPLPMGKLSLVERFCYVYSCLRNELDKPSEGKS